MPSRSRSRSRGRSAKRARSRSGSVRTRAIPGFNSRIVTRAPRRKVSLNMHSYSRYSTAVTLDVTSSTLQDERQFKFEDILGYSEFASLYDSYKMTKVVMMIQLITNPDSINPTNSSNTANGGQFAISNWFPRWWYIRDYDGGGSDSLASIKERQGVRCFVLRPNKINRIVIKPKVLTQAYAGATSTGYLVTQAKSLFIDMANTAVPHYGLNSVVDCMGLDPNDTYPFKIRIEFKYYFTCKDVR